MYSSVPLWQWFGVVFGVVTVLYYLNTRRRFYRLSSKIPGPKPLPILGNVLQILPHVKRILYKVCELLEEHGGIAAVWLGNDLTVFISDPEYLEIFFNSTKMLDRSHHYQFVEPVLGRGLFTANGDTWKKSRRIYVPTFSPTEVKRFVPIFQKQSLVLVDVIRKEVDKSEFDVFHYIKNCTLDFIFDTAMSFDLQSQKKYIPQLDEVSCLMELMYKRAFTIYHHPDVVYSMFSEGREHNRIIREIHEYAETLVAAKKKQLELRKDDKEHDADDSKNLFIDHMFKNGDFTAQEVRDHILTMAVTGYDTTGGTLGFILMMLGIHQDVQDKVYEEIKTVHEHVNNRELEAQDLEMLQYMDLVIKETLRLFPVGPIFFRKLNADVKFGNYVVPKGAAVGCTLLKTHRDPNIYPDPMRFNPNNFLPEKVEKRHPYSYAPFSAGPRSCIGMKYALMSMKIILLNLLANYRVLCDRPMSDIVLKAEITLKVENGFKIRLQDRHKIQESTKLIQSLTI